MGLIAVWDAFVDVLPWYVFGALGVALHLATPLLRLAKQKDVDDEQD
jgi:hypothetical protein